MALFIKDLRDDSKSVTTNIQSLRLNEVTLLKKEDYKTLQLNYGVPDYSVSVNNLCWALPPTVVDFLNQKTLRRIAFGYDYTLCPGTLNSTAGGKLTLKRISTYGKNSMKVVPDYLFEYSNNPSYSKNNWDGWGAYNSQGAGLALFIEHSS